jgi:adenine phosphoribosyltransferase
MRVGFIEVRKDRAASCDSDAWLRRTTPPDYRDRHLTLGFRRDLLDSRDRVLLVDDWIDTGGQALGTYLLTQDVKPPGSVSRQWWTH